MYHIQIDELGSLSSNIEMIDDDNKIDQIIDYFHDKDIKFEGQVENDDIGYIENNYTIYFSINTKDKTKKCARYIILDDGTIYYHLFNISSDTQEPYQFTNAKAIDFDDMKKSIREIIAD